MSNQIKIVYNLCQMKFKGASTHKTVAEKIKIAFYYIENSINKAAENFRKKIN